ncbi:uncharacterized protein N7484_004981 [Penicillium longicatenatum]|uniref:uncharacterized protein n=1 Tax=Penicillium longicatenatum TaxID=1561947 RepID=UPI0025491551|nr:uncharacterized protein N7484_004981 [Penicillium longicatenatum]KAJ5651258.1 hypothetical protein N7484_004981 [Penicillium longicatenatum]
MPSITSEPVIVVGASLVGLSAALCLASHHVSTIVLEKHAGISKHPRAIGFTPRTMEIYHTVGIENNDPAPDDFVLERAHVESVTGKWHDNSCWSDTEKNAKRKKEPFKSSQPKKEYSAARGYANPQDKLEPILEARALELGADIRRQHEVLNVEQDTNGVIVTVKNAQGNVQKLRGSYLIAADGNRSTVRELLQIPRQGRGFMQTIQSVLFHADLQKWTKGIVQFDIEQPHLKAFLASYSDGRWALMFKDDIKRDDETLHAAIYQAIGTEFPVEIITTAQWELTALVADTFQSGRVFLAGDAAHTLPPNRGGYGANTGIHDVHNLAWKLAAVLSGQSAPELLDTYSAERRPVALLRHDQIFVRADYKVHLDTAVSAGEKIDDDAMEFGQIYLSKGIVGANGSLPRAMKPDEWMGQPGTHLPHCWVERGGARVPILDIVGSEWTLVTASKGWVEAVSEVNEGSSVKIRSVCVGLDVSSSGDVDIQTLLGICGSGAVLVRPDGYIAWRSVELQVDAGEILRSALSRVAFQIAGVTA